MKTPEIIIIIMIKMIIIIINENSCHRNGSNKRWPYNIRHLLKLNIFSIYKIHKNTITTWLLEFFLEL